MNVDNDIGPGILPWTRTCFVCGQDNPHGLHLKSRVEHDGLVVLDYTTCDRDLGYSRIVHGGIAMTLLDEVMTWAAILAARRPCVAAELTTRMLAPIEAGMPLRVEGQVTKRGSRLLLTGSRLLCGDNDVLTTATGKYVPMPREHIGACMRDFVISQDTIALDSILPPPGS